MFIQIAVINSSLLWCSVSDLKLTEFCERKYKTVIIAYIGAWATSKHWIVIFIEMDYTVLIGIVEIYSIT